MLRTAVITEISSLLGVPTDSIKIMTPKHSQFGDYSLNVLSLKGEKSAEVVLATLQGSALFEKVELVGSFINFFVSQTELLKHTNKALTHPDDFGKTTPESPQIPLKIMLEYGTPNTHKLPHIGHLFSYVYGESLSRLLQWAGHEIFRENYQGDVGLHVAKCLYIVQQKQEALADLKNLDEKVQFLQTCYQEGSAAYEDSEEAKAAIVVLNKKIYAQDPEIAELWKTTREWSVEYYKEFEALLGVKIQKHYFESQTWETGMKLVKDNVGKIFEESDGAIIFKGENYGLHTRVFVTSYDTPTYEAKDMGLAKMKSEEWDFDIALVTTAREQNSYWDVVIKAAELVVPELKGKLKHFGFGFIDLKGGKMASRTGNILSGVDLVATVENKVIDTLLSGTENQSESAQILAVGAIKYAFLRSDSQKNMYFDIDESVSLNGNSGPYVQYAYARMKSIVRKHMSTGSEELPPIAAQAIEHLEPSELHLLRLIPRFEEVLSDAAKAYAPHLICTYVLDVTQAFNAFYENVSVLNADTEEQKNFRLALTLATSTIVKNALYVLGIDTIEKI